MTFTQFLTESQSLVNMLSSIVNSIPAFILVVIFTVVAFSIVLAMVNMVRSIRS